MKFCLDVLPELAVFLLKETGHLYLSIHYELSFCFFKDLNVDFVFSKYINFILNIFVFYIIPVRSILDSV